MKEVGRSVFLSSGELGDTTNVPIDQKMDLEMSGLNSDLVHGEEMEPKRGILYLAENLPTVLRRIKLLDSAISSAMAWDFSQFVIGRTRPRGDVEVWVHHETACDRTVIPIQEGVTLRRVVNRQKEAKRCLIVYGVPISYPLENFWDMYPEQIETITRFKKRGGIEDSETVEVKFYDPDEAWEHIQAGYIWVHMARFRVAPKFIKKPRICRVCKTLHPNHKPNRCTKIRCGTCSGPHATRDHPIDIPDIKCPVCSEAHEFHRCPRQLKVAKSSIREQKKTFADVVARRKDVAPSPKEIVPEKAHLPTNMSELKESLNHPEFKTFLSLLVAAILSGDLSPYGIPSAQMIPESIPRPSVIAPKKRIPTVDSRPTTASPTRSTGDIVSPKKPKLTQSSPQPCPKGCGKSFHPKLIKDHMKSCRGSPSESLFKILSKDQRKETSKDDSTLQGTSSVKEAPSMSRS